MTTTTLTKDQLRKLTPEQQEAFGCLEVKRLNSRQQLLKRARRGMNAVEGLLAGLVGGLAISSVVFPRILPIAILAASGLAAFEVARLHRRLDALMELLDEDVPHAD